MSVGRTKGSFVKGLTTTVAWMFVSSAMIILNKRVFDDGFVYPVALTALNQAFCVLGGIFLHCSGLIRIRPTPSRKYFLARILPLAVSNATTMCTGTSAYLYLSLAFIQILKSFTPAVTLVVGLVMRVERASVFVWTSLVLVAVGGGLAVVIESGTPAFHAGGFILFAISSISEAIRVMLTQLLLGADSMNPAELLVYQGIPTTGILLCVALLTEGRAVVREGLGLVLGKPLLYLLAFSLSSLVQLSTFLAIKHTSSLSFKMASCLKNSAIIWWGRVNGDRVAFGQVFGYLLSVFGFLLYAKARRDGSREKLNSKPKPG